MSHDPTSTTRFFSKKFSMLGAALSLLTPAIFAGCGNDNTPPDNTAPPVEITVGAMLPRTGPNANSDWVSAVELAVTHMNAAIKKAKMPRPVSFKLDEIDTASNEAMANVAMQTYSDEHAKIVISEASNAAIGANKWNYTQANIDGTLQIPVISFTATSASLNKSNTTDMDATRQLALQDPSEWFFRTCPESNALSNLRLAQVFKALSPTNVANGDVNGDGKVKVVWIGSSDTSTQASITGDRKAFDTYVAGLPAGSLPYVPETVLFDPGADPTTFNYGPAIAMATDSHPNDGAIPVSAPILTTDDGAPDLIINKALPTIAIPFIKAYKQNTANTTAIFQDGSFRRNTLLAALGNAADGQKGVSNIAAEHTKGGDTFKAAQQAVTGWAPAAYEAQAYDAAALSLLAIIKASITAGDPATITPTGTRDALKDLNHVGEAGVVTFYTGTDEFAKAITEMLKDVPGVLDYSGASGNNNFSSPNPTANDPGGNVLDRAVLWRIAGGQFVEDAIFDCVSNSMCSPTGEKPLIE